jgi:peroxiredoxin
VKNLVQGRKAPEIVGNDVDGKEIRLSDYSGKVVVLDFWADWCPHCVAMYPLERRMVKQYAREPFALLGINTDLPERLKELIEKKTVTWKNWSDGQGGPIVEQYRIEAFPSLYVIDHEGIIRYRNVRGEQLAKAVRDLLDEIPADALTPVAPPEAAVTPPADAAAATSDATPAGTPAGTPAESAPSENVDAKPEP